MPQWLYDMFQQNPVIELHIFQSITNIHIQGLQDERAEC